MGLSGEISGEDVQGFFGGGDFPGRVFFLGVSWRMSGENCNMSGPNCTKFGENIYQSWTLSFGF